MTIRVCVFKRAGRRFYECQWVDPDTGRKKTKSTGTDRKREAERFAGTLEKQLREGTYHYVRRITWAHFRQRFEQEEYPKRRQRTQWKLQGTFNLVERIINPATLAALNEETISRFAARLRELGREEQTVRGHLANIRTVLRWAQRQRLIRAVPAIDIPPITATTGRAITDDEFDRLLEAVPKVVGDRCAESWCHFIRGLWLSGLRISEALTLSWDDDRFLMVDLSGYRPMFVIRARGQKNRKDTLTPIAPEFAEMLTSVPEGERTGYVFNPLVERNAGEPGRVQRADTASKIVSRIGRQAGVKVGEYARTGKPRFAGAHDLRRAFGFRWAMRVLPPVLKELMRHADIATTMKFYVGRNAQATADAVWQAVANTSANVAASSNAKAVAEQDATVYATTT